jgi:hypothetical protein
VWGKTLMPMFEMFCQYCGKKWEVNIYFTPKEKQMRCVVCNDPNLKYKPVEQIKKDGNIFGYEEDDDD